MTVMKFEEINKESLAKSFESAAIECEIDVEHNEVYLKRGGIDFGVFLKIDEDGKKICLFTFIKCKGDATNEKLIDLTQKMNSKFNTVQFDYTVYDDASTYLNGHYIIYTNFGILLPQLIFTVKKFSHIFIDAIRKSDPDDVFFD